VRPAERRKRRKTHSKFWSQSMKLEVLKLRRERNIKTNIQGMWREVMKCPHLATDTEQKSAVVNAVPKFGFRKNLEILLTS